MVTLCVSVRCPCMIVDQSCLLAVYVLYHFVACNRVHVHICIYTLFVCICVCVCVCSWCVCVAGVCV